jgi:hypothetical protein
MERYLLLYYAQHPHSTVSPTTCPVPDMNLITPVLGPRLAALQRAVPTHIVNLTMFRGTAPALSTSPPQRRAFQAPLSSSNTGASRYTPLAQPQRLFKPQTCTTSLMVFQTQT